MKKYDTEYFIKRSNNIHNNKYNYSMTDYVNCSTKVKIICPIHGIFEQIAEQHYKGIGCPECFGNKKINTELFIKKSNSVHNNKYDYSLVNYINNKTKVIIICPKHGEFKQIPSHHYKGIGCSECSKNKKITTEIFIERSKKKFANKYDYSLTKYINTKTKIKIICPVHGIFEQTFHNHLNGKGCKKCNRYKLTTKKFIKRAKENAAKNNFTNVEFKLGDIESLPIEDESIDVIISNCVINLAPDKHKVFSEAKRVLKNDGKMYVSDIVLLEDISKEKKEDKKLLCGCVGGALLKKKYIEIAKDTGFDVRILGEDKEISKEQYNGINLESLKLELTKKHAEGSVQNAK